MTIASEFIAMAHEMLNDQEIGFDGTLIAKIKEEGSESKPWAPTFKEQEIPLRLFYDEQSKTNVNGSIVLQGEKVFITYEPDGISLEDCIGFKFIDHKGRSFVVNAVEPIGAGGTTIISYVKVGS